MFEERRLMDLLGFSSNDCWTRGREEGGRNRGREGVWKESNFENSLTSHCGGSIEEEACGLSTPHSMW